MVVVSRETYEVQEEEGSVRTCVTIFGGILDRAVTITVSTEDVTAIGRGMCVEVSSIRG